MTDKTDIRQTRDQVTVMEFSRFAKDVLDGLSSTPKSLSSKYFYDDEGSRLFQQIMQMPEYYLTDCELEIFQKQSADILAWFRTGGVQRPLDLVELGAGDGTKTAVLISHFLDAGADITYSPIDISQEAIDSLSAKFKNEMPSLKMTASVGDYFYVLNNLKGDTSRRKVLMFLGSNIGNFSYNESVEFFRSLRSSMNDGDLLFIGFDLQKDPRVIDAAYDDPHGITAGFNLNLLKRINRELGADFDIGDFSHYANYRPIDGAARSYLISRRDQDVKIDALGRSFHFDQWEAVFMEISRKYTLDSISDLAAESGFAIVNTFTDDRHYFCDSLWQTK